MWPLSSIWPRAAQEPSLIFGVLAFEAYVFVSLGQAPWLEAVAKRVMIDGGEPELTDVVNGTMVAAPPR